MLGVVAGMGLVFVGLIFKHPRPWVLAGLVLMVVCIACFAVLVLLTPTRHKGWRAWRRAGCCLECGYSRKGLAIESDCPECGAPSQYA